ncbi:MAG: hypothetical protein AAFV25_22730 [Bacteroidota bacterium]
MKKQILKKELTSSNKTFYQALDAGQQAKVKGGGDVVIDEIDGV